MVALRCWCRRSVLLPVHEMRAGEEISSKHQARTCLYFKRIHILEGRHVCFQDVATKCHHDAVCSSIDTH